MFARSLKNIFVTKAHDTVLVEYIAKDRSVIIPNRAKEIGDTCFGGRGSSTRVSEVIFKKGSKLKKIGNYAFGNTSLKEITIPKTVEEMGRSVFNMWTNVCFEKGICIKKVAGMSVSWTDPQCIVIPKTVIEIPEYCLSGFHPLNQISFEAGSNLKKIGECAFVGASLETITFPKSVEEIGNSAFLDCKALSEVLFEEGSALKKICDSAFLECAIVNIRFPKSLEIIERESFRKCKNLSEVTFEGSNIKTIEFWAFVESRLSRVYTPRDNKDNIIKLVRESESVSHRDFLKMEIMELIELTSQEFSPPSPEKELSEMVIDVNEYEKIRTIGSGAFGKVSLCQKGDSVIAAKFIDADGENQESFEREITNLKSLSHPFIVRLCGFALPSPANKNKFVIAMEYISGGSLEAVLENPPSWFDNTSKIEIICGIALGMSFVHSKGIIHRDLKPANVLLDEKHLPRVCDFGSSRLFSTDYTITRSVHATPVYAAPEVYNGNYDKKIDVYSFGAMLYEIVTGKRAFRTMNQYQLMKYVSLGKREPIPDSVTRFTRDLIERCWAQDPAARPSFDGICVLLKDNMHILFHESDIDRITEFRAKYFACTR